MAGVTTGVFVVLLARSRRRRPRDARVGASGVRLGTLARSHRAAGRLRSVTMHLESIPYMFVTYTPSVGTGNAPTWKRRGSGLAPRHDASERGRVQRAHVRRLVHHHAPRAQVRRQVVLARDVVDREREPAEKYRPARDPPNHHVAQVVLVAGLEALALKHEVIGDVRGNGLFIAVELVTDRLARSPATAITAQVVNDLRERGVLTGSIGLDDNILKLRPPLVLRKAEADLMLATLDASLRTVTS